MNLPTTLKGSIPRAVMAIVAGALTGNLLSLVPFFPPEWKWLAALATGAIWMFRPGTGTVFALLVFAPAVAYQALHLLPVFVVFGMIVAFAGPYSFLVVASALSAVASEFPLWTALVIPLALGFGKAPRAAFVAFAACLVLQIPILPVAPETTPWLASMDVFPKPDSLKPALPALTDFSWISAMGAEAGAAAGRLAQLLLAFLQHPALAGQAAIWAAAAATMSTVRVGLRRRPITTHLAATTSGMLVLFAGYFFGPPVLGLAPIPMSTAILCVVLPGILVALAGGILQKAAALDDGIAFPNSKTKGAAREIPRDTWEDMAGIDDIQREAEAAIDSQFDAATRRTLKSAGIRPTKGILLFGPPGTGKTKIARIIANQAGGGIGASFFAVSGSDFATRWFGESESNLRAIFDEARRHRPAVIFFDELEAFLPKRSAMAHADAPEKRIVATFLANTDGIDDLENILLVGATNHPDMIDPAALRPGRFDKLIFVPPPGPEARFAILARHLQRKKTAPDLDFEKLVARTERFTGADIEALCSSAMQNAVLRTNRRKPAIAMQDFESALSGIRPSVTIKMLKEYEKISGEFGRVSAPVEEEAVAPPPALSWSDVAGLEETKIALREAIEMPLSNPDLLREYGVRPTRGVLLFGPPGCGKTFLAKVVASEARVHFLHIKGPELLRGGTGGSEEALRDLFIRARENSPCVVFFDEIDAIAGARGTQESSPTKILTQLLTEIDGLEELKGVIVLAATNRPDVLDEALLRPGRFDRVVYVPPPDEAARRALLDRELSDKPLGDDIDIRAIAAESEGFSAAEIASFCNAAAMVAAKETLRTGIKHGIGQDLLRHCMEKTPRSLSPEMLSSYKELKARLQR